MLKSSVVVVISIEMFFFISVCLQFDQMHETQEIENKTKSKQNRSLIKKKNVKIVEEKYASTPNKQLAKRKRYIRFEIRSRTYSHQHNHIITSMNLDYFFLAFFFIVFSLFMIVIEKAAHLRLTIDPSIVQNTNTQKPLTMCSCRYIK